MCAHPALQYHDRSWKAGKLESWTSRKQVVESLRGADRHIETEEPNMAPLTAAGYSENLRNLASCHDHIVIPGWLLGARFAYGHDERRASARHPHLRLVVKTGWSLAMRRFAIVGAARTAFPVPSLGTRWAEVPSGDASRLGSLGSKSPRLCVLRCTTNARVSLGLGEI